MELKIINEYNNISEHRREIIANLGFKCMDIVLLVCHLRRERSRGQDSIYDYL